MSARSCYHYNDVHHSAMMFETMPWSPRPGWSTIHIRYYIYRMFGWNAFEPSLLSAILTITRPLNAFPLMLTFKWNVTCLVWWFNLFHWFIVPVSYVYSIVVWALTVLPVHRSDLNHRFQPAWIVWIKFIRRGPTYSPDLLVVASTRWSDLLGLLIFRDRGGYSSDLIHNRTHYPLSVLRLFLMPSYLWCFLITLPPDSLIIGDPIDADKQNTLKVMPAVSQYDIASCVEFTDRRRTLSRCFSIPSAQTAFQVLTGRPPSPTVAVVTEPCGIIRRCSEPLTQSCRMLLRVRSCIAYR